MEHHCGLYVLKVAQARGQTWLAVTRSKWLICDVRARPNLPRATAAAQPTDLRQDDLRKS